MENIDILIERSYQAIRKRGKITVDTDMDDFIEKMREELNEIECDYVFSNFDDTMKETVDLMNVCICALKHHGFDPIAEFEKCVIHNETRKD